ncbi:MAG TPA: hypothetical protein VEW48_19480 [Thermoanaerobaculia bacterium]|nr:hypothetical protein [Thermoanaerobaculia bacterium]
MKRIFRLCTALAILACSLTATRPASAVGNDFCDATRCRISCLEAGYSNGLCTKGGCRCF